MTNLSHLLLTSTALEIMSYHHLIIALVTVIHGSAHQPDQTTNLVPANVAYLISDQRHLWYKFSVCNKLKTHHMHKFSLAKYEQHLKWVALGFGILSTIAIVQNWYPYSMFFSLPFCLIWIYCSWLHTERQLKYINILFSAFYIYGIAKYFIESA